MNRRRLRGAIVGLVLGFCGALLVLEAVKIGGPDVAVETVVGTPDLNEYCNGLGTSFSAVLQSTDAYGWRCAGLTSGTWESRTVVLNDVCADQFGDTAYSTVLDAADPASWQCVVSD